MAKTLIVSSQPVVEGSVLTTILRGGITTLEAVSFVTNSSALPAGSLPSEAYAVAFSLAEDAGSHGGQLLEELYRSLKHGAILTIIEKDHKVSDCLLLPSMNAFSLQKPNSRNPNSQCHLVRT